VAIARGEIGQRWLVAEDALLQFLMEPVDDAADNLRDLLGPVPPIGRERQP